MAQKELENDDSKTSIVFKLTTFFSGNSSTSTPRIPKSQSKDNLETITDKTILSPRSQNLVMKSATNGNNLINLKTKSSSTELRIPISSIVKNDGKENALSSRLEKIDFGRVIREGELIKLSIQQVEKVYHFILYSNYLVYSEPSFLGNYEKLRIYELNKVMAL